MRKLLLTWITVVLTLPIYCADVPMPSPAGLEAGQLKLSAAELKTALPLLEARVTQGRYLERNGMINARTLDKLKRDYELTQAAAPSVEIPSNRIYQSGVPVYRQSDAALFVLEREKLLELRKQAKSRAAKSEQGYRLGSIPLLTKLLDEAEFTKLDRICKALNTSDSKLNDTLLPLPFFLQSTAALSKLNPQELDLLIRIAREQFKLDKTKYEANSPFVMEAEANLERLESARNAAKRE